MEADGKLNRKWSACGAKMPTESCDYYIYRLSTFNLYALRAICTYLYAQQSTNLVNNPELLQCTKHITMANTEPDQVPILPPRSLRVFGIDESSSPSVSDQQPRRASRIAFSPLPHKPSLIGRWRGTQDEETGGPSTPPSDRPLIPSALAQSTEVYSTPLPTLSMVVLSIVMSPLPWLNIAQLTKICRPCSESSSQQMCLRPFCCSWSKVRAGLYNVYAWFNTLLGFGEFPDAADVGFWTGILGTCSL